MSTAKKPTPEQARVLAQLAKTDGKIAYYKGGYWTSPGQAHSDDAFQRFPWHTSKGTVEAMERRGWLAKLDTGSNYDPMRFPGLNDRVLTNAGRALAQVTS
jgi:hypothetical protein